MEGSTPPLLTTLPVMTISSETSGFDYNYFLQEDVEQSASNSPSGSTSAANGGVSSSSGSTPLADAVVARKSTHKQRLGRRGHRKSRRGCYNCKKRRIKCQETLPACEHCAKAGLRCEYPVTAQIVHQPSNQIPLFSLQDMRLFQHFLLTCAPHHPLGNDTIWTHEIPCLSQNYEYLMHAILGLAASNLIAEDPSLLTFAITHRLKAIGAIKKALGDVTRATTFEEGNALLATCYALTFQSVCLVDGMAEFMTFSRGIMIIQFHMRCKGVKCIFQNSLGWEQLEMIKPLVENAPPIPKEWVDMAVQGITDLRPLCKSDMEVQYYTLISEIAMALHGSLLQVYPILFDHYYGWWTKMSHEEFQSIADPQSQTGLLLATHRIALKQLMTTATEAGLRTAARSTYRKEHDLDMGMYRWLGHINRQIDPEHRRYNRLPMWVEAQLDRDKNFFCRGGH
ncbi:C6 zinc finger protein [Biscogniauxia sp. FL1348]|nr:C6 zinc finger protein [Biscogniauxia sp. FL1348]